MALTRNRRINETTAPTLTPDITASYISVEPSWTQRFAAAWAGTRDGRRGIVPDPETGLTPFIESIAAHNATIVDSERLRTQAQITPLDQSRAQCVERREHALSALDELTAHPADAPDDAGPVTLVRRRRQQEQREAQLRHQIASATEQISILDEQRADRINAGALRIQRATQRAQHLVARYWRFYARHHPELPELRQVYTVPCIPVPPHPLSL
jgi:hypothetical protein